jgi:hypothetical protein
MVFQKSIGSTIFMIQNHFCDTEPFFAEYSKMVSLAFPRIPYQAEPFRGFCVLPDGRTPKKVLQNSFFFRVDRNTIETNCLFDEYTNNRHFEVSRSIDSTII